MRNPPRAIGSNTCGTELKNSGLVESEWNSRDGKLELLVSVEKVQTLKDTK